MKCLPLCGVIILTLGLHESSARPVRVVPPEELWAASDTVLNGQVQTVRATDSRTEITLGKNSPLPVRIMEATVKTLKVAKGEIAEEFTLHFPSVDFDRIKGVSNGPEQIDVRPGLCYRFYLRKKDGFYVGALDGAFDDGFAVQFITTSEAKTSSPLLRDDFQDRARAFFWNLEPEAGFSPLDKTFTPWNTEWSLKSAAPTPNHISLQQTPAP